MQQIIMAVNVLHKQNVVHRDLKLDNIMVELERNDDMHTNMVCKVTDFGFAKPLDPDQKFKGVFVGSLPYEAPEILKKEPYDIKVDIWAIGIIAYEILSGGELPFEGDSLQIEKNIIYTNPNLRRFSKFYDNGSLAKDFIMKCLDKEP